MFDLAHWECPFITSTAAPCSPLGYPILFKNLVQMNENAWFWQLLGPKPLPPSPPRLVYNWNDLETACEMPQLSSDLAHWECLWLADVWSVWGWIVLSSSFHDNTSTERLVAISQLVFCVHVICSLQFATVNENPTNTVRAFWSPVADRHWPSQYPRQPE